LAFRRILNYFFLERQQPLVLLITKLICCLFIVIIESCLSKTPQARRITAPAPP